MSEYPVACSRCGEIIGSAAEDDGTDGAPLCVICWWDTYESRVQRVPVRTRSAEATE